jgi:hypothetical protein
MALKIFTLKEDEEWDLMVRSFHDYDTYWLSGYVKAFEIHGDGEPLLFYFEEDNTRGINVVMKRDIAKNDQYKDMIPINTFFDFSTPYGYGGWLIEGDNKALLFETYGKWCVDNGIVSEFVRFHPLISNHSYTTDNYDIIPLGNTVALDLSSPEVIWNNFTSKNRNMIRKAQKNGIKIYFGRYPEIYEIFREIYNDTMTKDNAEEYYYFEEEFYQSILNDLPQNAQVFYAVYKDQVIAASLMLAANGYMNYHLSGSVREFSNLAPTNLLLYEAALWGCANGCKTLYLGGGVGSSDDSLFKFKKAFYRKTDLPRFYIGRKIWDEKLYDELCELRNVNRVTTEFFPAYRSSVESKF